MPATGIRTSSSLTGRLALAEAVAAAAAVRGCGRGSGAAAAAAAARRRRRPRRWPSRWSCGCRLRAVAGRLPVLAVVAGGPVAAARAGWPSAGCRPFGWPLRLLRSARSLLPSLARSAAGRCRRSAGRRDRRRGCGLPLRRRPLLRSPVARAVAWDRSSPRLRVDVRGAASRARGSSTRCLGAARCSAARSLRLAFAAVARCAPSADGASVGAAWRPAPCRGTARRRRRGVGGLRRCRQPAAAPGGAGWPRSSSPLRIRPVPEMPSSPARCCSSGSSMPDRPCRGGGVRGVLGAAVPRSCRRVACVRLDEVGGVAHVEVLPCGDLRRSRRGDVAPVPGARLRPGSRDARELTGRRGARQLSGGADRRSRFRARLARSGRLARAA